jgi:hypothetical protein
VDDPRTRRDLATIRAALERLQRYLTTLGHPIFARTDVHLAWRRCDGGPMDRGPGLGATSDHRICLYLGKPDFPHDALAGRIAGHEAQTAFADSFGVSPDAFYRRFERRRAQLHGRAE